GNAAVLRKSNWQPKYGNTLLLASMPAAQPSGVSSANSTDITDPTVEPLSPNSDPPVRFPDNPLAACSLPVQLSPPIRNTRTDAVTLTVAVVGATLAASIFYTP